MVPPLPTTLPLEDATVTTPSVSNTTYIDVAAAAAAAVAVTAAVD